MMESKLEQILDLQTSLLINNNGQLFAKKFIL